MIWTNAHKKGGAKAIVDARLLCGNEKDALQQYADDYDLKYPKAQSGAIFHMANMIWRNYQKEAGVHPKYWIC